VSNKEKGIVIAFVVLFFTIGSIYRLTRPIGNYEEEMEKAYALKLANPELMTFDGYDEPPIPDREENEKTLLGVDSNNNGLRDDVEIWINRTQSDPGVRNAMRQIHFHYQEIMKEAAYKWNDPRGDEKERQKRILGILDNMSLGVTCLYAHFDDFEKGSEIYDLLVNVFKKNDIDRKHYRSIARSINGVSVGIQVGLTKQQKREKYCIRR
jgi:hypothetical protein